MWIFQPYFFGLHSVNQPSTKSSKAPDQSRHPCAGTWERCHTFRDGDGAGEDVRGGPKIWRIPQDIPSDCYFHANKQYMINNYTKWIYKGTGFFSLNPRSSLWTSRNSRKSRVNGFSGQGSLLSWRWIVWGCLQMTRGGSIPPDPKPTDHHGKPQISPRYLLPLPTKLVYIIGATSEVG